MKLSYKAQITLSVLIILLANILTDALKSWVYRSIGFVICGLLFIVNPVMPIGIEETRKSIFWARAGGIILILIGIFTRVHHS